MSRIVRLLCAALVACGSVPLVGVGPAAADEVSVTPSNAGYFFSKGIDKPDEAPAAPPNATAIIADGVAPGNLAVAADAGTEDKASFLYFDLFSLPTMATVTQAVVTMTPVANGPEGEAVNVSYNEAPESIVACAAGPEGFKDDDGAGLAKAPARLCTAFKAVGKAAGEAYTWDVTALAQQWVAGANDGVAFTRADESPGANFQVVFGPSSTAKLALSYTVPESVVPPLTPPVTPPVIAPPAVGGALPPPTDGFVPTPDVAVPNPVTNPPPAPVTANPATPTRTVALSTSMRPSNQFWLAGLGLAALLVLVSLVLGDPSVPVTGHSRSRLSQALQGRGATPSLRARPL